MQNSLFVFSIVGPKQNAGSLLTPVTVGERIYQDYFGDFFLRVILRFIFHLKTILETIFNLAIIFGKNSPQNSLQMGNKPQNNPQKKVTKIVLVDAFTLSKG